MYKKELSKCGKLAFDTHKEAQAVISYNTTGRRKNRHRATKQPKRVYKCQFCGKWHLTSKKNKKAQKMQGGKKRPRFKFTEKQ